MKIIEEKNISYSKSKWLETEPRQHNSQATLNKIRRLRRYAERYNTDIIYRVRTINTYPF